MITNSFDPKSEAIISLTSLFGEQKKINEIICFEFSCPLISRLLPLEKCKDALTFQSK